MKLYLKCVGKNGEHGSVIWVKHSAYECKTDSFQKYDDAPKRHLSRALRSYSHTQESVEEISCTKETGA